MKMIRRREKGEGRERGGGGGGGGERDNKLIVLHACTIINFFFPKMCSIPHWLPLRWAISWCSNCSECENHWQVS